MLNTTDAEAEWTVLFLQIDRIVFMILYSVREIASQIRRIVISGTISSIKRCVTLRVCNDVARMGRKIN